MVRARFLFFAAHPYMCYLCLRWIILRSLAPDCRGLQIRLRHGIYQTSEVFVFHWTCHSK